MKGPNLRSLDGWSIAGALVLAVIGNYVYDFLSEEDRPFFQATLVFVVVWGGAVFLLLHALRSISSYDSLVASERPFGKESHWRWLNTLAGALGTGAVMGTLISFLWLLSIFESQEIAIGMHRSLPGFMNYEIGLWGSFLVVAITIARRQTDWLALAVFSASFTLAASIVVRTIDPEWNNLPLTLLSYTVLSLALMTVALLVQGRVRSFIHELIRQR